MLKFCYPLALLALSLPLSAATTPETLSQWEQWILDGHPAQVRCPYKVEGNKLSHQCIWAGELKLNITPRQLDFELSITTNARVWVQLPGDQQQWPMSVLLNDTATPVVPKPKQQGKALRYPGVMLDAGQHQLFGQIPLDKPITSIRLPEHRGLVSVMYQDTPVSAVDIDSNNTLWLNRQVKDNESSASDSAHAKVFRKLTDDIPMRLETRLELSVSGSPREITVGEILPPAMILTRFDSELPARIDSNGLLTMQVRPGQWTVSTRARYSEPRADVGFRQVGDIWPVQEIWSFAARPQLRGVNVSGAVSIDPSQLSGPPSWQQLPTYRLDSQQPLLLEERYRGEQTPQANKLRVEKTIWMDFDGEGATVQDHVQAQMHSGWRLSAAPDVTLGRASVNGRPQVITELTDGRTGIEVRESEIALETASRLNRVTTFSASGWHQPVDRLSATLILPPGWKIWHIGGPDRVSNSWLSAWNLWDIFVCVLIIAVVSNILGKQWALLTALMLGLTYLQAPTALFASATLLFLLGFMRLLPQNRLRHLVLGLSYGVVALLLLTLINFSVQGIRQAIYPQLQYRHAINTGLSQRTDYAQAHPVAGSAVGSAVAARQPLVMAESMDQATRYRHKAPEKAHSNRYHPQTEPENIQTGPGVPTWEWHRASLGWSGPVTADEQVRLYLTGPLPTRLLHLLQVALLWAFAGRLLLMLWQLRQTQTLKQTAASTPATRTIGALTLMLILNASPIGTPPIAAQENYPPQFLLEEYEQRLLKKPECGTACYSLNQVKLITRDNRLELKLSLSALETIGLALPRFPAGWQPSELLVDEQPATHVVQRGGQWYLLVEPGIHEVSIIGQLLGEEFTLEFDQPHNVSVDAPGFEVTGLHGNRVQSKSLTLRRKLDATITSTLLPDPIAPFVAVYRHLELDQDWVVKTTVTRLAPLTGSLNLHVPLLAGEKIRVDGITTTKGAVAVSLANGQQRFSWQSTIEPAAQYTLRNRSNAATEEHWSVAASPRWRIETSGLPMIKAGSREANGDHHKAQVSLAPKTWRGSHYLRCAPKPDQWTDQHSGVRKMDLHSRPPLQ